MKLNELILKIRAMNEKVPILITTPIGLIPYGIEDLHPFAHIEAEEEIWTNPPKKEFIERQNLRDVYAKNLSPSVGFDTEKFLKSRSLLTPVFSYNEAVSKYDMISRINMSNKDIQSEVNIFA